MFNFFSGMKRKEQQEFDKLSIDKKAELLQAAIVDKVSGTMAQELANAMILGMELEREQIYQKYVTKIDDVEKELDTENWCHEVDNFLSFLRMEHFKYQQNKIENMKDSEKNET